MQHVVFSFFIRVLSALRGGSLVVCKVDLHVSVGDCFGGRVVSSLGRGAGGGWQLENGDRFGRALQSCCFPGLISGRSRKPFAVNAGHNTKTQLLIKDQIKILNPQRALSSLFSAGFYPRRGRSG